MFAHLMIGKIVASSSRLRIGHALKQCIIAFALALLPESVLGQTFDSTSDGSDGALNLTVPGVVEFNPGASNPKLDANGDGIFHFTSINIGPGVTVRLGSRFLNGSVFWLASGAVTIDGTIDLSGESGPDLGPNGVPLLAAPGAGGFPGGVKQQAGFGPTGGSPGFPFNASCFIQAAGGGGPSNAFLLPLLGGSGGGGGTNGGSGAAGGGALLIASSVSISVNGTIRADGGANPFGSIGGDGGGGAIRLVAPTISGAGTLSAKGTGNEITRGQCLTHGMGASGVIRLEAFQHGFAGTAQPTPIRVSPFALFLPPNLPRIRVVSADGQPVKADPTGSFSFPDVAINKATAVPVVIEAQNIPAGTVAQLFIFSENGSDQIVNSSPLVTTTAPSLRATATVLLPPGFSRGFVRAKW